jgi:hypothetical protein
MRRARSAPEELHARFLVDRAVWPFPDYVRPDATPHLRQRMLANPIGGWAERIEHCAHPRDYRVEGSVVSAVTATYRRAATLQSSVARRQSRSIRTSRSVRDSPQPKHAAASPISTTPSR